MLSTLFIAFFMLPSSFAEESPVCDKQLVDAQELSCRCIRSWEKSTVYIKGQPLRYTTSVGYCSEQAQPEIQWIVTKDEKACPIINCHEPLAPTANSSN